MDNITREELDLIANLYTMYNDNISQIYLLQNDITRLRDSNTLIRNTIIDVIYSLGRLRTPTANDSLRNSRYYLIFQRLLNNTTNNDNTTNNIPTQAQIEQATRNVMYCDIMAPINTVCPISLEQFNDTSEVTVIRHCGHIFHRDILQNWFIRSSLCPSCRYDIRNISNINDNTDNNNNTNNTNTNNTNTNNTNNNTNNNNNNTNNNTNIPNLNINNLNELINNFDNNYDEQTQNLINMLVDPSGNFQNITNTLSSLFFTYPTNR
jgi:hypothetical protein